MVAGKAAACKRNTHTMAIFWVFGCLGGPNKSIRTGDPGLTHNQPRRGGLEDDQLPTSYSIIGTTPYGVDNEMKAIFTDTVGRLLRWINQSRRPSL